MIIFMDSRQSQLLNLVIENHIATALPIGSKFLLEKSALDIGEATVRNDLRALEEEGYLTHPHTSAGRVPTEKGYKYYLENLNFEKAKISKKENDIFGMSLEDKILTDKEQKERNLAKTLAEVSGETVILAFTPEKFYYTGLTNLFSKPEFSELEMVANMSQIFDQCEDCLKNFYNEVDSSPKFFVGSEHNFGNMLSVVAFKFDSKSLLALLGPMRMDYAHNYALINKIKEIINN